MLSGTLCSPSKRKSPLPKTAFGKRPVAAGRDSTGEAKELLANAKRWHESVVDLISKLPSKYDARGYKAKARIIEGVIDEMEKQIFANHREDVGGA